MEQGARKNVKKEQGEWTKTRREQGAETPPLGASLLKGVLEVLPDIWPNNLVYGC